jgi:hypothetical protein
LVFAAQFRYILLYINLFLRFCLAHIFFPFLDKIAFI